MVNSRKLVLRNLILDMDGVLWRGDTPMVGLAPFFDTLNALQINYVLATNNATKVATQYAEKLQRFGVSVAPEAILTSAEATASFLRERYGPDKSVYVVGDAGLRLAMESNGYRLLARDASDGIIGNSDSADIVVVGFTTHACYYDLASAARLINRGALFVGTNPDVTFPHETGPLPGAGAYLAFLQAATGREPLVVGKPRGAVFEEAVRRLGGSESETAMVGDRLETDIAGAKAAGLQSVLLLSGVTSRQQVAQSDVKPDLVLDDIEDLRHYLLAQNGPVTP